MWHNKNLLYADGEKSTDSGWVNGVNLVGKKETDGKDIWSD